MDNTSLLLLALALAVAVAVAGAGGVLGWLLAGFLLSCGAYAAWTLFGRGRVVLGGGAPKKKWW